MQRHYVQIISADTTSEGSTLSRRKLTDDGAWAGSAEGSGEVPEGATEEAPGAGTAAGTEAASGEE
eukprot:CAMPEP_0206022960 /NCGR_PEP_ID=MMETSP1464-20131121/35633_1 /ASSEMBLY_ACC=CAM_ASM_001124 /TAXON_ID=119497 /ORGANISM="Exanthemachrysis gayraliae, Strain RCC1523" /LENGTH=65 /DNA_ID=CAMNT_0053396935 /DNA_START=181 /DNA_END=375 /DNA_ORIENTATION=+